MKILLVEDHKLLAQVNCDLLREVFGHEVVWEATLAGALAAFERQRFDLALLDINLPDGNGYQLAEQIRRQPGGVDIVLVALTGIGNRIDQERAEAVGIDACFTKPMDFEVLPELTRR
jgi:CheY-like chemotaxis protein